MVRRPNGPVSARSWSSHLGSHQRSGGKAEQDRHSGQGEREEHGDHHVASGEDHGLEWARLPIIASGRETAVRCTFHVRATAVEREGRDVAAYAVHSENGANASQPHAARGLVVTGALTGSVASVWLTRMHGNSASR
jgi:hypothetical protein